MSATLDFQYDAIPTGAAPPAYLDRVSLNVSESNGIDWVARRWLTRLLPFDVPEGQEPLSLHADWSGPMRLVPHANGWRRLCEIPFPAATFGDSWLDPQRSEELGSLLDGLIAGPLSGNVERVLDGWVPPSPEAITGWLSASGHLAAVDEDKNLRLTLKCRGCDGQVKIHRDAARLRLSMRLGQWSDLSPVAEQAMTRLMREVNSQGHFARIVWSKHGSQSTCEAQVDLSGIPTQFGRDVFWQEVLCAAVLGLELALRRLGLELDVLANPKNQALAERLMTRRTKRRRKPR